MYVFSIRKNRNPTPLLPQTPNTRSIFAICLLLVKVSDTASRFHVAHRRTPPPLKQRIVIICYITDHVLLSADYSQLELRVLAHLSKDQTLLRVFSDDDDATDVFCGIAADILNKNNPDDVSKDERQMIKQACYGLCCSLSMRTSPVFTLYKRMRLTL